MINWFKTGYMDEVRGTTSFVPEGLITHAYSRGAEYAASTEGLKNLANLTDEEIENELKRVSKK